jgi:acyl carrier protein
MTHDEILATVLRCLTKAAPGVDAAALAPDAGLRDELDLDSMDYLNFVVALHEELGVDIPETDYRRLTTLRSTTEYLAGRLGEATA